jgi:chemotaxis signal transduction protein
MRADPDDQMLPVLTFSLAKQRYGLLVADVVEVVAMVELMTVQEAPEAILGMVNRHGAVLPMIDLRRVLGHEAQSITTGSLFVVVQHDSRQVGLVVDEVHQVEYVDTNQLQTSTKSGKYIRGIISHRSALMQVINPEPLLEVYASDGVDG